MKSPPSICYCCISCMQSYIWISVRLSFSLVACILFAAAEQKYINRKRRSLFKYLVFLRLHKRATIGFTEVATRRNSLTLSLQGLTEIISVMYKVRKIAVQYLVELPEWYCFHENSTQNKKILWIFGWNGIKIRLSHGNWTIVEPQLHN